MLYRAAQSKKSTSLNLQMKFQETQIFPPRTSLELPPVAPDTSLIDTTNSRIPVLVLKLFNSNGMTKSQ